MGFDRLKVFLVEGKSAQGPASHKRDQAQTPKKVHGFGGIAAQKFDGDQIQKDLDGAGDPILGYSLEAGMMLDGNLRNPCPRPGGKNEDKAMHLSIESNMLDNVPTIALQSAAVVVQVNSADPADQAIG